MPFSLAVASKLWVAVARLPARSEPVNSQYTGAPDCQSALFHENAMSHKKAQAGS
jgi:hypothetical protein